MKKQLFLLGLFCVLLVCLLVGCGETPVDPPIQDPPAIVTPTDEVTIVVEMPEAEVRDREVTSYDYTKLFSITKNGEQVEVKPTYLNLTELAETPGSYQVTCTYSGVTASATVHVFATTYTVTLKEKTVSVKCSESAAYDYRALFAIADDAGLPVEITDEMVTTDFTAAAGTYSYTVAYGGSEKTLTITVIPDHQVEIMASYRTPTLAPEEVVGFDLTTLFSLYVDGVPVKVTVDMLDATAVPTDAASVKVGDTYPVTLTYTTTDGLTTGRLSTILTVAEPVATILTGREVNVYINARPLDLTTLFTIKRGGDNIPVTVDMVSGDVNYTVSGDYTITLTYGDETATSVVHVIDGVVLGYAKSDTVQVKLGSDMSAYPFAADFEVVINGIRFYDLPISYFDLSQVDFAKAGTYSATLTVPYNEKAQTGLRPPAPVEYTIDITYVVVENDYEITLLEPELVLSKGTTSYDVFKNLYVTINGKWQTLTDNPDWVNFITCYAKVLSAPPDLSSWAEQTVRIAVYVNGPAAAPVEVSYILRVESGITISAGSTAIFSGSTLYVKDLFTIREGYRDIPVTADMISGKVDVFTPGTYEVSIEYGGMTETAKVVVLDHRLLGSYFTPMTTVPYYESSDNDEEEDVLISGKRIADLVIGEDGSISFASVKNGRIMAGSDANTLLVRSGLNDYTLYYRDGIIILDPENSLGTPFSDYKRPLVYFNADMYSITNKLTVGYSNSYVLMESGVYTGCYSIDTFEVTPKEEGSAPFWFGLYVKLIEKSNGDTFYTVKWGEASYPAGFEPKNGATSTLTFDGEAYPFTMWNGSNGKVDTAATGNPWANTVFTGTIDGEPAELRCDRYGHVTLLRNGVRVAYVNVSVSYGAYAEFDEDEKTIKLYAIDDHEGHGTYSYLFRLDPEAKTFTYETRDRYFGKYVLDKSYFFFDGYGCGRVSFDPASYSITPFHYTVSDSLVKVTYLDTNPKFAYGTGAEFYLAPLLNVLTVRSFTGADLVGRDFVNEIITDGAIVNIGSSVMASQSSNSIGREALLSQITITTKDGVMGAAELAQHVVTNTVSFSKAGFYLYTIKLTIGGEEVTTRYALEILPKTYTGNALAVSWHAGLLGATELMMDECGYVTLRMGTDIFRGMAEIGESGFVANVYDDARHCILLRGNLLTDSILTVTGSGYINFTDAYTIGAYRVIGTSGVILRELVYQGTTRYYLSDNATILGTEATVRLVSGTSISERGAVICITAGDTTLWVQIGTWGDASGGLVTADAYRGSYTTADGETLTVDGFGSVTLGALTGTYRVTASDVLTVSFSAQDVRLYRLSLAAGTYAVVTTPTGEALVAGATYSGTYNFICGSYPYAADTSFAFRAGGVVVITSTSEAHDSGEDFCYDDVYSPPFASATGVTGTYTVTGDRVTVTVNGETFVFHIPNLQTADQLVCESTTLASDAHGQFTRGTAFGREA